MAFQIPEDHTVICGLSIGQKGKAAAVNRLQTDRAPVSEFAHFTGYER